MYQERHDGVWDECEVYPPERSEGGIHTSHIATMSLEVHTTFCVQIGGKSRVAYECVLAAGSQVSSDILPVAAGGMNISPDSDAKAQLTACRSTRKHAMRLFPPVWTQ